jgi:hypothetical protein
MKNKGLIIGGVAIIALGAFLFMRRRNQMAEENGVNESDSKSDTSTGGMGIGSGTTNTGGIGIGAGITTTGGSVTPTPAVSIVPMPLTLKPINNAVDLQGTKLGTDIGLTNASTATLGNVTNAIARLGSVGREVLNYISDTNSLQRATPEFAKGLDAKVGQGASALNFAERLVTFLSRNKSGVAPFPSAPAPSTSFNGSQMDYENEDFAFNGHTF